MTLKYNPFTNKLDIVGTGGSGGGDVSGPGSSTDNAIVRWNGTTGTVIQNSVATLSDTGDIVANSIDLTVPVAVADGGTNISSYTSGDILYASGSSTLSKLPIGSSSQVLTVSGGLPTWSTPAASGVTSVSGTSNQINSTGGTTPVLSLSSTITTPGSLTTTTTLTSTTLFSALAGQIVAITTPGAYPYTTLATDFVILVDSSAARTITPLGSPATGQMYRIKDNTGSAALNNITITPSGKNIDGAASKIINSNYGSVDIVYNGTQWNLL